MSQPDGEWLRIETDFHRTGDGVAIIANPGFTERKPCDYPWSERVHWHG